EPVAIVSASLKRPFWLSALMAPCIVSSSIVLIITCLKFGWPVNHAFTFTCDDCVAEYLQMILKTFLLGILKPPATSAFGAVSNMMLTLAPTSGSVHSTSAVSLGLQCFAFACWANQVPCVVPVSAQT